MKNNKLELLRKLDHLHAARCLGAVHSVCDPQQKSALTRTRFKKVCYSRTQAAAMRTRSQRSQRSDGSPELSPMPPASLASLPEAVLEHTLMFVDENQDARCRAISRSWARLRRVWVLHFPQNGREGNGEVAAVAFSPDGSLLAVGAKENLPVKLYDAVTGDLRRALSRGDHDHWKSYPHSLAFTPDGTVLATGCSGKICVYNVATGESSELWRTTEQYQRNEVTSVAFSPDGSTFAFCHVLMAALLGIGGWIKAPRVLATSDWQNSIKGVAFSPTGSVLAVGVGTTLKCFDVATGQPRLEIEYGVAIYSVVFSSRGTVAVGGGGRLTFYDGSTGRLQQELRPDSLDGSGRFVNTLCFSPDGSTIAANTEDSRSKSIDIYDAETGELFRVIGRDCLGIKSAAFSADGKSIALGDWVSLRGGGKLTLYDVETLDLRRMRRPTP